jgi:hypothetical protein
VEGTKEKERNIKKRIVNILKFCIYITRDAGRIDWKIIEKASNIIVQQQQTRVVVVV